jgi:hypothetical protein
MTARLTIWDQALINLAGWLAVCRWPDPNRALVLVQIARVIPHVNHDNPLIGPLAQAAQAVCDHSPDPKAMALLNARMDLEAALARVFLARAAQACAQLWPDENTDFTTPLPGEPAHAAE